MIDDSLVIELKVSCLSCGTMFAPGNKTALERKALHHAECGHQNVLEINSEQCGCANIKLHPHAPYRVSGHDLEKDSFDLPFDTFTAAVREFLHRLRVDQIVHISGVSNTLDHRLNFT